MANGFLQKPGLDYHEVFAPVARIETIRLVVVIASYREWLLYQLDVKSTFLNGPLDKESYESQPLGFEGKGQEDQVNKLKKALYGLKQAPRAWNKRINSFLMQQKFVKCTIKHGVYIRNSIALHPLIVCLYVDVLLVFGSNEAFSCIKRSMRSISWRDSTWLIVIQLLLQLKQVSNFKKKEVSN